MSIFPLPINKDTIRRLRLLCLQIRVESLASRENFCLSLREFLLKAANQMGNTKSRQKSVFCPILFGRCWVLRSDSNLCICLRRQLEDGSDVCCSELVISLIFHVLHLLKKAKHTMPSFCIHQISVEAGWTIGCVTGSGGISITLLHPDNEGCVG